MLALFSCDGSLVHSYRSVGGEWHKGDTVLLADTLIYDAPDFVELFAGVRCSAAYRYKDLWLLVEVLSADAGSVVSRDTVRCAIYDDDGRLNGATAGVLYQTEHYVTSLGTSYCNPFHIRLTHLMSDSLLHGVYDVGVRLVSPCRRLFAGK